MIRKPIKTIDPKPKMSASVIPASGGIVDQSLILESTWYPDRTLTPLVLIPVVSYTDGSSAKIVENASSELTNGNWYKLDKSTSSLGLCEATKLDFTKKITAADGSSVFAYSVVSTVGATDYGKLTVRENTPPGDTVSYIFTASHGPSGRTVYASTHTKCVRITQIPEILFDNDSKALYNPISGARWFTINPSLNPAYPVTWSWKSYHASEGGWGTLGSTKLDWAVSKVGDGVKIDRSKMQDRLILRCIGIVSVEGVQIQLQRDISHTRRMPHFEFDIERVGALAPSTTTIAPYAQIKISGRPVEDASQFDVRWYGASDAQIASGRNPSISTSALGSNGSLGLNVKDSGGYKALTDNGAYLVDSDGALIILK